MCLKGLIAAAFKSSEPLCLLRLNGRVGAIKSTDSDNRVTHHVLTSKRRYAMTCY